MEQNENTEPNDNGDHPSIHLSHHQFGLIIIVLGALLLIIGILSWFFTIPMFSRMYLGEIIGIIFIVVGVKQFLKGKR